MNNQLRLRVTYKRSGHTYSLIGGKRSEALVEHGKTTPTGVGFSREDKLASIVSRMNH